MIIAQNTVQGYTEVLEGGVFDSTQPTSKTRRGRVQGNGGDIAPTITTHNTIVVNEVDDVKFRRITERESFRLMGLTDGEIDKIQSAGIPSTQQYRMAGNSIVVDVLAEIFKALFVECDKPEDYLF